MIDQCKLEEGKYYWTRSIGYAPVSIAEFKGEYWSHMGVSATSQLHEIEVLAPVPEFRPDGSKDAEINAPLTEGWLRAAGFKWHQFDRQPSKHWLLWIGGAVETGGCTDYEDLGIEVAAGAYRGPDRPEGWFCWLRDDAAGRYHRFIHLRTICTPLDLVQVIEGITGQKFTPDNCRYGMLLTQARADRARLADQRLDRQMMRDGAPWSAIERDDTRGRALPEHMEAHAKARGEIP